ncbi:MAG: hypothetical protein JNN12_06515 [Bacteroidetes Order II. Incertae sedis bacterium]|nr:hypothetical protein [Bacteroidetes Order II. bacterium]
MRREMAWFGLLMLLFFMQDVFAQNKVDFSQLLYAYLGYYPKYETVYEVGLGYIPKLSAEVPIDSLHGFKMEASLTLGATAKFRGFEEINGNAGISPYRLWIRYATPQAEARIGLQSIEFGSAQFLRPLQWFDQKDPNDPLRMSRGVYALLGRYYFPNNANVWGWGLYGNKQLGLQYVVPVSPKHLGLGGRFQLPIPKGEAAISFNRSTLHQEVVMQNKPIVHENRFGFDAKADLKIGVWVEMSFSTLSEALNKVRYRRLLTFGVDYTVGLGNGLSLQTEHLISSFGDTRLEWGNLDVLSVLSLQYPLTLSDMIGIMVYRQWKSEKSFVVAQYRHDFRKWTVFAVGFLGASQQANLPESEIEATMFTPGIRFLLMYHR